MFTVDKSSPYVVQVPNILTPQECEELVRKIDKLDPVVAPINTAQGQRVRSDVRNNERVMFDDENLAQRVFDQVKSELPETMRSRQMIGANERFRCYRYKAGMRFAPHADGSFERNELEKSFYTFLIYLNDGFQGGETNIFTQPEVSVKPELGLGLLFQHPLLHEGAEVISGTKYVARTDVMYRKPRPTQGE